MNITYDLYTYKATVVKVVDGDTLILNIDLGMDISLNNLKVRLARIDCEEIHGKKKTQHGLDAKAFVENMLRSKEVIVKTIKDKGDKFDRMLVEVYFLDAKSTTNEYININDLLMETGFAVNYKSTKLPVNPDYSMLENIGSGG